MRLKNPNEGRAPYLIVLPACKECCGYVDRLVFHLGPSPRFCSACITRRTKDSVRRFNKAHPYVRISKPTPDAWPCQRCHEVKRIDEYRPRSNPDRLGALPRICLDCTAAKQLHDMKARSAKISADRRAKSAQRLEELRTLSRACRVCEIVKAPGEFPAAKSVKGKPPLTCFDCTRARMAADSARMRHRQKGLFGVGISPASWARKKESYGHRCAYCGMGGSALERDHVLPISVGGASADVPDNIVPACRRCNASKSDLPLLDWLATHPDLDGPVPRGLRSGRLVWRDGRLETGELEQAA